MINKMRVTIHTATYNRGYILGKAYQSLRKQTCKDFEWIITDDGSDDGTEEMVKEWLQSNNGFPIVYNKLAHVGIPRALNSGVKLANSDWFMMLDSDDYILPETIEKVCRWIAEIDGKKDFAGIGFARCFPNGHYMKPQMPLIAENKYVDATHLERKKYNIDMDMCEVHRVDLLKKYPFEYWKDEKYAPEQLNFYNIALEGYKLRWRNEKLYICDYLPDGQTKDNRLVKNNPIGFAMMYNQNMLIYPSLKDKMVNAIRMTALCLYGKSFSYLRKSNYPLLTILTFPLGVALFLRRWRQYKKLS